MYRNIVYNSRKRGIHLWTWDDNGNRIDIEEKFKPYLYIEQRKGNDGVSIFKTPLKKREFETDYDRRKFVENSGIKRFFHNLPVEQQYLLERYSDRKSQDDFTANKLRTFFFDIEVYSPDEFPRADEANHEITAITIYDSLVGEFHTWGLGAYISKAPNEKYHQALSESDLLRGFMKYWISNYPDIVSGWNSDGFDIPYIVNRLTRLFGNSFAEKLSPTGRLWSRDKLDRFKNPITEWTIQGITSIDYMKAYKKFSRNDREKYTLDYIGEYELGVGKTNFKGSLVDLADTDWKKFIEYNIRDVDIIKGLEDKLHYLELCRMVAYKGYTKLEKGLETNNVVAGLFAYEASKQDLIIPTFIYEKGPRPPGGLVRKPDAGFNDDVVSFDAASLYPNTMISLNLSPETKLGQTTIDDNFTYVKTVRGKEFKIRNDAFMGWMVDNNICKSVHGTLFSQHKKGIIPLIIEDIYSERKRTQRRKDKTARELSEITEDDPSFIELDTNYKTFDILQYTLKILMNSLYGTFGNQYSVMYDLDLVGSITLTGQEVNHQACVSVANYVKSKHNFDGDLIIYGDTDSIYLTLTPLFNHLGIKMIKDDTRIEGKSYKITKEAMSIIKDIGGEKKAMDGIISKHLSAWALREMNAKDPRFEFKREKISKCGLFLNAKKNYVIQVIDNEGIKIKMGSKKEFAYTGLAFVSSTTSKEIRAINDSVIEEMIISKNVNMSNDMVMSGYEQFSKLTPDILATRMAVKNLKKYEKNANGFTIGKGTPQNSKASLLYNHLLDFISVDGKYNKIKSGDKIKILYVSKNKYGLDYIGFLDDFPLEFGMEPDYNKLYLKNVYPTLERIFVAVGWGIINPTKRYKCDLLSEFGYE